MEIRTRRPASGLSTSGTLAASDIDKVIAHLQSLGIDASERTSDAKVKTVMIVDPDENHLALAETIDQGMARQAA